MRRLEATSQALCFFGALAPSQPFSWNDGPMDTSKQGTAREDERSRHICICICTAKPLKEGRLGDTTGEKRGTKTGALGTWMKNK